MDLQNLMPQQAQPINRIPTGQLSTELAELSEEVLGSDISSNANVLPFGWGNILGGLTGCSYDGDDAE